MLWKNLKHTSGTGNIGVKRAVLISSREVRKVLNEKMTIEQHSKKQKSNPMTILGEKHYRYGKEQGQKAGGMTGCLRIHKEAMWLEQSDLRAE